MTQTADGPPPSNDITFPGITRIDIPPERVQADAGTVDLDGVVVIGWTKDGKFYAASSYADGADVMFLCEMVKQRLVQMVNEGLEGK